MIDKKMFISIVALSYSISCAIGAVKLGDQEGQIRNSQSVVDSAFEKIRDQHDVNGWGYAGSEGFYSIADFDEEKYITYLIKNSKYGEKIALLDYGAGIFGWNRDVIKLLQTESIAKILSEKNLHVTVVGVRGELGDKIDDDVSAHIRDMRLCGFKIENLIESFAQLGLADLRFDFTVANWTLRHLVDPVGDLKEILDLTKIGGYVAFNGFFMKEDSQEKTDALDKYVSYNIIEMLTQTGCHALWFPLYSTRDIGQALIQKTLEQPFFPYAYQSLNVISGQYHCYSESMGSYKLLTDKLIDSECWWKNNPVISMSDVYVMPGQQNSEFVKFWNTMHFDKPFSAKDLEKYKIYEFIPFEKTAQPTPDDQLPKSLTFIE